MHTNGENGNYVWIPANKKPTTVIVGAKSNVTAVVFHGSAPTADIIRLDDFDPAADVAYHSDSTNSSSRSKIKRRAEALNKTQV